MFCSGCQGLGPAATKVRFTRQRSPVFPQSVPGSLLAHDLMVAGWVVAFSCFRLISLVAPALR